MINRLSFSSLIIELTIDLWLTYQSDKLSFVNCHVFSHQATVSKTGESHRRQGPCRRRTEFRPSTEQPTVTARSVLPICSMSLPANGRAWKPTVPARPQMSRPCGGS